MVIFRRLDNAHEMKYIESIKQTIYKKVCKIFGYLKITN